MLAVYSGTKAFLATFSSALGPEVKKHNIVVEHVNTYFVVRNICALMLQKLNMTTGVEAL